MLEAEHYWAAWLRFGIAEQLLRYDGSVVDIVGWEFVWMGSVKVLEMMKTVEVVYESPVVAMDRQMKRTLLLYLPHSFFYQMPVCVEVGALPTLLLPRLRVRQQTVQQYCESCRVLHVFHFQSRYKMFLFDSSRTC